MKKFIALLLLGLISACSSPTPNFYQPTSISDAIVSYQNFKGIILVNNILMPAEASRPQITTLGKKDYELIIDEFNRWGATPEKLVQRVVNENLNIYLPNAIIENQTPLRKDYKYAVAIEITKIGGRLNQMAELEASYFIKNKQGKIIKSGKFAERININGKYDAYVPAQSNLLASLCAKIAKDIAQ